MGALVWVMIGLAIWHFTIFVPGPLLGRDRRRVRRRADRLGASSAWPSTASPSRGRTTRTSSRPCEAVPGALLGIAAVYFYGASQGNEPLS